MSPQRQYLHSYLKSQFEKIGLDYGLFMYTPKFLREAARARQINRHEWTAVLAALGFPEPHVRLKVSCAVAATARQTTSA